MIENWSKEICELSIGSKTLAIALYDISGNLKYSNTAMIQLCKGKPDGNFINPTLARMLEITLKRPFHGVITFGDESVNNYSIEGSAIQKDGELLVIGEVNVAQLVKQNVSMTLLNQQINNLQRQLIKEKKMLQKANHDLKTLNEEKNRILGIAAHDLRSPMATTYAFTDFLIDGFDSLQSEEIINYLKQIRNNSNDALTLLNDLLDISAIESGKLELKKEVNNYILLIGNVIENLSIFAKKKNISISFETQYKTLDFIFDRLRLQQVITNLLSNAIKYSASGTAIIVVCSIDDGFVKTEVIDQGQGIAPEEIELLFQPFHTTPNITTGGERSTGLGLSIVKKIITEHCGRIDVESSVGKGSNFRFWIKFETGN